MKILKQRCEAILLMMILGALTLGAQNIGLQIEGTGFGANNESPTPYPVIAWFFKVVKPPI